LRERNWERFGLYSSILFRFSRFYRVPSFVERAWIVAQGPYTPTLVSFIREHSRRYDRIVFLTYLYYPTVYGLPEASGKTILIPTAHDESALQLGIYKRIIESAGSLIFLSEEERGLVQSRFSVGENVPCYLTGFGVEASDSAFGPKDDYFLYAGRVELGKNCPELFEYCRVAGIRLKVIGSSQIEIPEHVDFIGFVDETEKKRLLARSRGVIIPSKNESLSIVALEAWALGKPVIAHSESPVLAGHIKRSGGGFTYGNLEEFKLATGNSDPKAGENGHRYVKMNYSWEVILPEYRKALGIER
jgi:glycosyltransferase involved in cell wall biosynthesis